jgi:hypothetical protein
MLAVKGTTVYVNFDPPPILTGLTIPVGSAPETLVPKTTSSYYPRDVQSDIFRVVLIL